MKDKKTLKITSIIVAVLIAIFCITKILAAGIVYEDGEEWESTDWGYYVVTEDGEVIYAEEEYKSKDGTYTSVEQLKEDVKNKGIYYDELDKDGSIFCIEQGQQLPSRKDETTIRKMGSGSSLGDQYHNGTIAQGLNPQSTSALTAKEVKALQYNRGDTTKALKGGYAYNYFSNGTYYSRSLKDTSGRLNPGKITTLATENDGSIKWSDGTEKPIDSYEKISWEDAYVLANSDPMANTESNPAQLALWKLGKLNKGKTTVDSSEGDELYEKALLFGTYRQTKEEREKENGKSGPVLVNGEQDYKYKFVFNEQGNYLIAGPIKIDYGDLTLTSDNAELEVRQIENFTVWGTLADSDELRDISEYVEFTDAEGNKLENMNETVGTTDGQGAGKEFPKSNEEFYIKVAYNSPIYTEVIAINSLEASFKELDVRALGYKLSDIPVYYTQWLSNNIIKQDCTEKHTLGGSVKCGTHLKGDCNRRPRFCSTHSNQFFTCSITIDHKDNYSASEGILLKGTTSKSGNAQMLLLLHKAELYWRRYKLVVLFGPENQNPPDDMTPPPYTPPATESPDIPHRTYIDIGGNVWVDDVESKTGELDGVKDTGADYPRPNVKVTLHFEDESIVQKEDVAEWARDKFENPVYTDDDGNYMFYQLPMDKKYYVEFTYDGMMYTTTKFLAGGSASGYKSNPNEDVYETNSKAEEQNDVRESFNERFEEIFGVGSNSLQNEQTTGRSTKISPLNYKTKKFGDTESAFPQSRLLTTDNEEDIVNNHATGKAKEEFEISTDTRNDKGSKTFIYPFGDKEYTIWDVNNPNPTELEYLKHINLGLKRRPTADLNLAVDIKAGGTSIKDKTKLVVYKSNVKEEDLKVKENDEEFNKAIDGNIKKLTSGEVVQQVAGTDYYWHKNFEDIYKVTEDQDTSIGFSIIKDELNVYVLYKIFIANQSETKDINATVTGLVDYFSEGLTVPTADDQEKIEKIFNDFGILKGSYSWTEGENSTEIKWSKPTKTGEYNKIETEDLDLKIGGSGEVKSIYLVLKVDKDNTEKCLVKDNGMENIAEIKSYKFEQNDKPAGLVDCDSAPYNATPGDDKTYEDDTDDAPMFKLELNWSPKEIKGNVWDELDKSKVDFVKVDLVEYIYDKDNDQVYEKIRPGLEIVGNETVGVRKDNNSRTGQEGWNSGEYKFVVEGGNYAIRFTYGDTEMLLNNKKYNGQDYQASTGYKALSTIYTERYNKAVATTVDLKQELSKNKEPLKVDLSVEDILNGKDLTQQKWENENFRFTPENNSSNARDLTEIRAKVIESAIDLTNKNATLLHRLGEESGLNRDEAEKLSGTNNTKAPNYTYMEAISDIVIVESNDLANECPKIINLGLQERPKASINLEKVVSKIVIKTNDGTELINTADASKLSNLQDLTNDIQNTFINMDTKSMEGATIDIDYTLTVTNNGSEPDKLSNYQYTTNTTGSNTEGYLVDRAENFDDLAIKISEKFGEPITTTDELPIKSNVIYDYVNINLEYRADDLNIDESNSKNEVYWEKVYDDDAKLDEIPHEFLKDGIKDYLTKDKRLVSRVVKTTETANENLTSSNTSYEIPIHLGITLAEDINQDNLDAFTYSNCAEIIQIYSGAGRRDYDVIPGDYEPYQDPEQPDESLTGRAVVTPPLGEENRVYYVITIISATIIIVGIVLIKKKVLKK